MYVGVAEQKKGVSALFVWVAAEQPTLSQSGREYCKFENDWVASKHGHSYLSEKKGTTCITTVVL